MTTYMFGKSVTSLEKAFLSKVLVEPTRLEQGKHFNMIRNIAIKNDISLEQANVILEDKKKLVNGLNSRKEYSREKFSIDKYGNVVRKNLYTNRSEIMPEDAFVCSDKKAAPKKQNKVIKLLKYYYQYIKEMFTVY